MIYVPVISSADVPIRYTCIPRLKWNMQASHVSIALQSQRAVFPPITISEDLLMKSTEIDAHSETDNQWMTSLFYRRQELSIQLARLDVEIGILRRALRAPERFGTKGVLQGLES
jgi:hypothetical protein